MTDQIRWMCGRSNFETPNLASVMEHCNDGSGIDGGKAQVENNSRPSLLAPAGSTMNSGIEIGIEIEFKSQD